MYKYKYNEKSIENHREVKDRSSLCFPSTIGLSRLNAHRGNSSTDTHTQLLSHPNPLPYQLPPYSFSQLIQCQFISGYFVCLPISTASIFCKGGPILFGKEEGRKEQQWIMNNWKLSSSSWNWDGELCDVYCITLLHRAILISFEYGYFTNTFYFFLIFNPSS